MNSTLPHLAQRSALSLERPDHLGKAIFPHPASQSMFPQNQDKQPSCSRLAGCGDLNKMQ